MKLESRMKPQHGSERCRERVVRSARRVRMLTLVICSMGVFLGIIGWSMLSSSNGVMAAGSFVNPHSGNAATTDTCAACHRTHDGQASDIVKTTAPQQTLCMSCHDGTGANSNVQAEFSGATANNATTGLYYQHPTMDASSLNHTSGQTDEFAGVRNRHAECTDCHNPHQLNLTLAAAPSPTGWSASGDQLGTAGVTNAATPAWINPLSQEYQLCLKCHSRYTVLKDDSGITDPRYKSFDKAAELDGTGSFHPITQQGKNQTAVLQANLQNGRLWHFSTTDTVRCVNCHGNKLLVNYSATMALNSPAKDARLAPHGSTNRSILIANYNDVVGTQMSSWNENNFALCFLCHDPGVFDRTSNNTNFNRHQLHAGELRFVCAECHYRVHSTTSAYYSQNVGFDRLINFAPDVTGSGGAQPLWSLTNRTCTLTCHGENHSGFSYSGAGGGSTPTPTPTGTRTPTPTATPTPVPIAFRAAAASNNGSGGTTITMTRPTGVQNGDVLIMAVTVHVANGASINTPSGWTRLGSRLTTSDSTLQQAIYWRIASSEPQSYNVTFSVNPLRASGVIAAVSGASGAQPTSSEYRGQANSSSLTVSTPGLGTWTAVDGIDLFFGGMAYGGNTPAPPSSYTQPSNGFSSSGSGSGGTETEVAYKALTSVATVGALTETWSGTAAVNIGHHVFVSR